MSNDTTLLFGLDGVEVVGVEVGGDDIPTLALVTADEQARSCPGCGVRSQRPHSWERTRPRDLPVAGRSTALTWTKRPWRCQNTRCVRKTFSESLPAIPPVHAPHPYHGLVAKRSRQPSLEGRSDGGTANSRRMAGSP